MSDHYRTLGLHPNASKSDIKNAYFRLALSYHPDHHAKADAAGRAAAAVWFRRVKDAYEVLYDDRRRAEYDRTIRAGGGYGNRHHGGASPRSSDGGTSYSKESEPEWILKRARARGHGGGAYSSSSGNGNRQGQQHGAGASSKSSGGGTSSATESDSEWMWERARTRCHGDGAYSSSTVHGNRQSQSGGTSSSSSGGGTGTSSSTEPDSGWIWERARTRGHGGGASTSSTGYAHGGTSSSTTSVHGGASGSRPPPPPWVPRRMAALFVCWAGVLGGSTLLWSMHNKRSALKQQKS